MVPIYLAWVGLAFRTLWLKRLSKVCFAWSQGSVLGATDRVSVSVHVVFIHIPVSGGLAGHAVGRVSPHHHSHASIPGGVHCIHGDKDCENYAAYYARLVSTRAWALAGTHHTARCGPSPVVGGGSVHCGGIGAESSCIGLLLGSHGDHIEVWRDEVVSEGSMGATVPASGASGGRRMTVVPPCALSPPSPEYQQAAQYLYLVL